jgi:NAD(P)-dependent dehydrogenase (short-subunit alcohol dehydrogenase family)
MTLEGRVAIVTGGGSGLGAALAREMAARGARVVIADVDLAKAQDVAASIGGSAEPAYLDVSDAAQVGALVSKVKADHGSVDIMVNNAGILMKGELLDLSLADWNRISSVNLGGVVSGALAAYSVMARQKSGHIINIASLSALTTPPLVAAYATTKSAVVTFSLALAAEAETHGVRVSVVCPGNIRTPMLSPHHISRFTPAIPVSEAAARIVRAAGRGEMMIVFPAYARLMWWMERLHHCLLAPLRREVLRRARRQATASGQPPAA